jgi:hypothetical protein
LISKELGIGQKEIHISELSASNVYFLGQKSERYINQCFSFKRKSLSIGYRMYEGLAQQWMEMS